MPEWLLLVDGVVVDGVVEVDAVVVVLDEDCVAPDEPEAALAIAALPPASTPAAASVTSALRNRFTGSFTSSRGFAISCQRTRRS